MNTRFRDAPFVTLGVTYQQAVANYIVQGLGGVVAAERYPAGGEGPHPFALIQATGGHYSPS